MPAQRHHDQAWIDPRWSQDAQHLPRSLSSSPPIATPNDIDDWFDALDPVKLEPANDSCFIMENPTHDSSYLLSASAKSKSRTKSKRHSIASMSTSTSDDDTIKTKVESFVSSQALAPPTEVPLRATQAPKKMKGMMGVFRINPFAMHSGFVGSGDGKSGLNAAVVMPGVGWEPGPLEEEPVMFEFQLQLVGYDEDESDEDDGEVNEFVGVVDAEEVVLGFAPLHTFSPDFDLHTSNSFTHASNSFPSDYIDQHVSPSGVHGEERYTSTPSVASASGYPEDHQFTGGLPPSTTDGTSALLPPVGGASLSQGDTVDLERGGNTTIPVNNSSQSFGMDGTYHPYHLHSHQQLPYHPPPLPLPPHMNHSHHIHERPLSSASSSSLSSSRCGPPPLQVRHNHYWSGVIGTSQGHHHQQQQSYVPAPSTTTTRESMGGEYEASSSSGMPEGQVVEDQYPDQPGGTTSDMQQQQHYPTQTTTRIQNQNTVAQCESPDESSTGSVVDVGVVGIDQTNSGGGCDGQCSFEATTGPTVAVTRQVQGFQVPHHHQQQHVHSANGGEAMGVSYQPQQQQSRRQQHRVGMDTIGVNGLGLYSASPETTTSPSSHLDANTQHVDSTSTTTTTRTTTGATVNSIVVGSQCSTTGPVSSVRLPLVSVDGNGNGCLHNLSAGGGLDMGGGGGGSTTEGTSSEQCSASSSFVVGGRYRYGHQHIHQQNHRSGYEQYHHGHHPYLRPIHNGNGHYRTQQQQQVRECPTSTGEGTFYSTAAVGGVGVGELGSVVQGYTTTTTGCTMDRHGCVQGFK